MPPGQVTRTAVDFPLLEGVANFLGEFAFVTGRGRRSVTFPACRCHDFQLGNEVLAFPPANGFQRAHAAGHQLHANEAIQNEQQDEGEYGCCAKQWYGNLAASCTGKIKLGAILHVADIGFYFFHSRQIGGWVQ